MSIRGTYQFKGFKKVANAIKFRQERFEKRKQYIFVDPLDTILNKIKRKHSVAKDPMAHPRPNGDHIFRGYMYKNIKAMITEDTGDKITVQMGYFVPYGVNLEEGHPPFDPDPRTIRQWTWKKYGPQLGHDVQQLRRLAQAFIRGLRERGSKPYPILVPLFFSNIRRYTNNVMSRFGNVFLR